MLLAHTPKALPDQELSGKNILQEAHHREPGSQTLWVKVPALPLDCISLVFTSQRLSFLVCKWVLKELLGEWHLLEPYLLIVLNTYHQQQQNI